MQIPSLFKQGPRSGASLSLSEGLRRWQDALLECLPAAARSLFDKGEARMVLELSGGDSAEARLEKGDEVNPVEKPVHNRPEELKTLSGRVEQAGVELVLLLPRKDVLLKKVYFPAQVKENLQRVLSYEIDRLTPFQADEVYFDFRQLPSPSETQLQVELACVKRERVATWLQGLESAGRSPQRLQWPGAWSGANLLPNSGRRGNRGERLLSWLLWGLVLLLAAASLATPLLQKRQIVIGLGERMNAARAEANQATELRSQLEQAGKAANFTRFKRDNVLQVSELLRRLTEQIPDHTWVNQLNVAGGNRVDFRGESEHATELIEILSKDPAFRQIRFKSPVVGIRNTERERFHIEFIFNPGGGAG